MSLYANYVKEKTSDHIFETDKGFATYRYLEDQKAVYIVDIYVLPDFRETGYAKAIADYIRDEAVSKGFVKMLGSVVPTNKDSTVSVKVLLAYGMELKSASDNFIIFEREI